MNARIGARMPRVAQAALNAGQQRLGHADAGALAPPHAAQGQDHRDEEHGAREKRASGADPGRQRAGQRGADRARDVERDRAQRHGARQLRRA